MSSGMIEETADDSAPEKVPEPVVGMITRRKAKKE